MKGERPGMDTGAQAGTLGWGRNGMPATSPGTPPVDVIVTRQVSWLAGRHVGLAFPAVRTASDT
jgi:hypothetical protein